MNKKNNTIILYSSIVVLYIVITVLFLLTPAKDSYDFIIRIAALLGLTSMIIATMMTPFMVQLYKYFGQKFIKVHHLFSVLGLILATIHPVAFALYVMNIAVFVPVFYPFYDFWLLAGRPALIIIYVAVLAAIFRKKVPKYWKQIHFLNYVAILFGYVHGILIGTDFKNLAILVIFTIMTIAVFCGLIYRRYL
ncbi:MAG: hypothetical protein EU539_14175, partial [Promethearchaeota archaeon]